MIGRDKIIKKLRKGFKIDIFDESKQTLTRGLPAIEAMNYVEVTGDKDTWSKQWQSCAMFHNDQQVMDLITYFFDIIRERSSSLDPNAVIRVKKMDIMNMSRIIALIYLIDTDKGEELEELYKQPYEVFDSEILSLIDNFITNRGH